jgi:chorismate mutase
MDDITLKMIELLKTRTDIAKEIGEVKKILVKESLMRQEKTVYVEK